MRLTLIALMFCCSLYAQNKKFDPENSKGQLFEYATYTNVKDKTLDISQVINNKDLVFHKLNSDNHSVGFTSNNYWVTFMLKNTTNSPRVYYLETARPITDQADLYQISGENITHYKSGDQISFDKRQVNHRATVFKIELPANSTQEFYLHFLSDGETINLPLNLYSESEFFQVNYSQQLFLGFFYGLLFLAGLIYLFFYTSLKEKSFLYYGFYVFSIALLQGALDGLIFQYILPQGGYFNSRAVMVSALFSNFFLLKYCEYFLKVKNHMPLFYKGFQVSYGVIAVLFVMVFINKTTLKLTYPISNVNGLLSLILILATVFSMRFKRVAIDRYFSIGIFFLVIGLLGFVMNNLSLLPNNFYTLNSAKFGAGFEVIFLSISMTNLIKKLRLEKEKSQDLALKKSQEISQLKTYFMSNMSHELRTPINAIMGVVQEQLGIEKNKETRSNFEIVKNASVSLLSTINDILDFEKIEKNELQLKRAAFNPSLKLNQISSNWEVEAKKKGLDYQFEIDYRIPAKVYGDADRFLQIINNIIGNAVKFTQSGAVKVVLRCSPSKGGFTRFSFHVSDTGIGINSELKESVYDSFSQMRQDHKRQFSGVGLGLTIAKYLVKLFNGTIAIESEEGKGTDVYVDIPLEAVVKKATNFSKEAHKDISKPLKILVVEDNAVNQMIMKKLLGAYSKFSIVIVENGLKAIEALKEGVYDVVLMDLQMPIMDGYEATKIIRSGDLVGATNIPIIAVTADAMQETRQRVLDFGMNDYMTKPVNKELLYKKITQHYDNSLSVV